MLVRHTLAFHVVPDQVCQFDSTSQIGQRFVHKQNRGFTGVTFDDQTSGPDILRM